MSINLPYQVGHSRSYVIDESTLDEIQSPEVCSTIRRISKREAKRSDKDNRAVALVAGITSSLFLGLSGVGTAAAALFIGDCVYAILSRCGSADDCEAIGNLAALRRAQLTYQKKWLPFLLWRKPTQPGWVTRRNKLDHYDFSKITSPEVCREIDLISTQQAKDSQLSRLRIALVVGIALSFFFQLSLLGTVVLALSIADPIWAVANKLGASEHYAATARRAGIRCIELFYPKQRHFLRPYRVRIDPNKSTQDYQLHRYSSEACVKIRYTYKKVRKEIEMRDIPILIAGVAIPFFLNLSLLGAAITVTLSLLSRKVMRNILSYDRYRAIEEGAMLRFAALEHQKKKWLRFLVPLSRYWDRVDPPHSQG